MNAITPVQARPVRFHARSFVAFALVPQAPLAEWLEGLDRWTENSPGFFAGRPVVLDLNHMEPHAGEISDLVAALGERGIRIYAIETDRAEALGPDLPPLLSGAKATILDAPKGQGGQGAGAEEMPQTTTLTIDQPVRSGQSIFHPRGDVIVIGSTSSGSEIIAGGSVHVYGTLRGRAFAGATGNSRARIFCRRNEAELLVLDGWYRTADDMHPSTRGTAVQAYLEGGTIRIEPLN